MTSELPTRSSPLSLPELEYVIVGAALLVPYLSLPFIFRFVPGMVFILASGCLVVASLHLRVNPIRKALLAVATSLGLLFVSISVGAVLLSLAGVTRPMDPPFVFLPPTLVLAGAYTVFVRRRGLLLDQLGTGIEGTLNFRQSVEYAAIAFLPCLGASGAHVMNITGWHGLSVGFYLFVVAFVLYFLLRDGISPGQYFAATYALGLGLVFALTLRTTAAIGADVHGEIAVIRRVLDQGHWIIPSTGTNLDSVVSMKILGPFLVSLFDITPVLAVKLLYPLFIAAIPLSGFVLFRTVVKDRLAFAGAVVTMLHVTYWGNFHSSNRMAIAVVFTLAFLVSIVSVDRNRILEILFIIGLVISHYTVAVIFGVFYFLFVTGTAVYRLLGNPWIPNVTWRQLGLIVLFTYFWYEVVHSGVFFDLFVLGIVDLINTAATYAPSIISGVGVGNDITAGSSASSSRSVPDILLLAALAFEFGLMGLGALYVTLSLVDLGQFDPLARLGILETEPSWLDIRSASIPVKGLWVASLAALGMFGFGYVMQSALGASRIQNQMQFVYTVLLFPGLFVVSLLVSRLGCSLTRTGSIDCRVVFRALLVVLIVLSIPLQTGLVHLGVGGNPIHVNLGGPEDDNRYLSQEDVAMAGWLADHAPPDSRVHADDQGRGLLTSETSPSSLSRLSFHPQGTRQEFALVRTVVTLRAADNRSQIQSATGATLATESMTWKKVYDAGTSELYYRSRTNVTQPS